MNCLTSIILSFVSVKSVFALTNIGDTAFAAIKNNGRLSTWGNSIYGGDSSSVAVQLTDVVSVASTSYAFAALKEDGSVVSWGGFGAGGDMGSIIFNAPVVYIAATDMAFAALQSDGSVTSWGEINMGGDQSSVASDLTSGVIELYSSYKAFAAIKEDRTVVCWGRPDGGGNATAVQSQLTNVDRIFATESAFAALKSDGSVITWGAPGEGGDSSLVSGQLLSGIDAVYANPHAFAAVPEVLSGRAAATWGGWGQGGYGVPETTTRKLKNIVHITAAREAFASMDTDGRVVTWGDVAGGGDSSTVASEIGQDVAAVYATDFAFAAVKLDGSCVVWGDSAKGGDASGVSAQLTAGVRSVKGNRVAFAAIKDDGSVVTWGSATQGGNSSSVAAQLVDVQDISAVGYAFAALLSSGKVISWGDESQGGEDTSSLSDVREVVGRQSLNSEAVTFEISSAPTASVAPSVSSTLVPTLRPTLAPSAAPEDSGNSSGRGTDRSPMDHSKPTAGVVILGLLLGFLIFGYIILRMRSGLFSRSESTACYYDECHKDFVDLYPSPRSPQSTHTERSEYEMAAMEEGGVSKAASGDTDDGGNDMSQENPLHTPKVETRKKRSSNRAAQRARSKSPSRRKTNLGKKPQRKGSTLTGSDP